jgi:hypothetical protein
MVMLVYLCAVQLHCEQGKRIIRLLCALHNGGLLFQLMAQPAMGKPWVTFLF